MEFSVILFFFGLLTTGAFGDDVVVRELPSDLQADLKDILQSHLITTRAGIEQCDTPTESDVSFLLYTRNTSTNPISIRSGNLAQLDSTKKLVMLVHGWISGPTGYGFPEMINAYLKRYDCNVIFLDWSKIAWKLYTTSQCSVPGIGAVAADFLCAINQQFNVSLSSIHIIGHSLGAHVAGFTGKRTRSICGQQVGRITGLDPAGPLYQDRPRYERLDKSDALFVDVIHTNALQFGYWGNIGSVDFQVNCGMLQPGCIDVNMNDFADFENIVVSAVACSHLRALDLMTESVASDLLKAKSCELCPVVCKTDILKPKFTIMGESTPQELTADTYWISTKKSFPYAKGCVGYPLGCS